MTLQSVSGVEQLAEKETAPAADTETDDENDEDNGSKSNMGTHMNSDDVAPLIRRWAEVYVGSDAEPAHRGLLLWHSEGSSVVVNAGSSPDMAITTTKPINISSINKIVVLEDPPWLVDSNKSATLLRAARIVADASAGGD